MVFSSLLVIGKPFLLGNNREKNNQSLFFQSNINKLLLVGIGAFTGAASGMFGVGGGIVMVPVLSLIGDQQAALGTSLMASIGPTIISAHTHYKLRNTSTRMVLPLMLGSAIGVLVGSMVALSLTDMQQRALFSTVMLSLAGRNMYRASQIRKAIAK